MLGKVAFRERKTCCINTYVYAVLCMIQIVGHNNHAPTFCNSVFTSSLDPCVYSEECSLAMIPMSGLNFPLASYGSIFREINLQNHALAVTTLNQLFERGSLLPFHVSMQQEGPNLCLELLKATPNHSHFVYFLDSIVDTLPLLIMNWVGIVKWSILVDGICALGALGTHAYLCTRITCVLLSECCKISIQGGMLLEYYKQKPHIFVVATHAHLMRDLIK